MILTNKELRSFYQLPFVKPVLGDESYALITSNWMTDKFYPWFWELRTQLGLKQYSLKNDCNKITRAAAQCAQDCHAVSTGSSAHSVAIGEFWYTKEDGENHAVLTGVFDNAERKFFDAQTGKFVVLTFKEIQSCDFLYF